ncbi:VOC family protein [Saccharopolyspora shandongensis]|uniref:VOC family protein n=1 Tax=Saccharopolyspora shandongensis TaxID=418495 RepID=UPI003414D233
MLTTADLEAAIDFYTRVLGVEVTTFREERKPLVLGASKINLDRVGHGSAVVRRGSGRDTTSRACHRPSIRPRSDSTVRAG